MRLRWDSTVTGSDYKELLDATRAELKRFFGDNWERYWQDLRMDITAESVTTRGGDGRIVTSSLEYTAALRVET